MGERADGEGRGEKGVKEVVERARWREWVWVVDGAGCKEGEGTRGEDAG